MYSDVVDDVVQMRRASGGAYPAGEYFFHQDDQGNVLLVTDASGAAVERYDYDDFGYPTIIDPATGQPRAASAIGNRYLFTGREWDADTRLYHYRFRDYDPSTGRFVQRDPLGVWGDLANLGNGTAYVGNNPWTYTDPYGLITPTIEALRDSSAYNEPWDRAVQEDYFDGGYTGIGAPASYMVPDLYFEKLGAGCNVGGGMGGRGGIGAPGLSPAPSGAGGVQAVVPPAKISCSRPQCGGYRSGVANTGVGKPTIPLTNAVPTRGLGMEKLPATSSGLTSPSAISSEIKGGTYVLRDPNSGQVMRTGRTDDLGRRRGEHRRDPTTKDLDFEIDMWTDSYAIQRGREQMLYDKYPGAMSANGGLNKIRPISPRNPNCEMYMKAAEAAQ